MTFDWNIINRITFKRLLTVPCCKTGQVAGSTAATTSAPPYAALAALAAAHVHETHPHRRHRRYGVVVVS